MQLKNYFHVKLLCYEMCRYQINQLTSQEVTESIAKPIDYFTTTIY